MARNDHLIGNTYGRLYVEAYSHSVNGRAYYTVKCACGNVKAVRGTAILRGCAKSCGCITKEKARELCLSRGTHKMSGTRVYNAWCNMRDRCNNPKNCQYKDYGGRGITHCSEWSSFEAFYADMGDMPQGATLGRIDNDAGYSPSNCRWESKIEQANNTRRSHFILVNGERMTVAQAARVVGMSYAVLKARIGQLGWSVEKAISTPVRTLEKKNGK